MNKQEALKRLDALESEAKKLRQFIEEPEQDHSQWIGKWGFVSDEFEDCRDAITLHKLVKYDPSKYYPFKSNNDTSWRFFRLATPKELGNVGFDCIEPDWSKAPEWADYWGMDSNGASYWYETCPSNDKSEILWVKISGVYEKDSTFCPNWRNTLHKRPE